MLLARRVRVPPNLMLSLLAGQCGFHRPFASPPDALEGRALSGRVRPSVMRCVRVAIAALAFLFVSGAARPAHAADPITMQVASPLALTATPLSIQVKVGRWFPVAVTLGNTGDAVQGRLQLRLTANGGPAERDAVFYADVDLPANQARKRVWLYGRADGQQFDGAIVSFAGRGFKTLAAPLALISADLGTRLILTISDADEKLSYLSGLTNRALGVPEELSAAAGASLPPTGGRQTYVRPLGASRDLVPDRWIGFEAADMVVLQDFPHSALTPEQIAALRGYVACGGVLLVPGGANWQRLAQSPLNDLWPVLPTSSAAATPSEVREIVSRALAGEENLSGADRLGGAPVVLTRGALRPDARRVLSTASGAPLLATRDIGAGRVVFLAMEPTKPPFLGWRGLEGLWVDLARQTPKLNRLESIDRLGQPFGFNQFNQRRYPGYNPQPIPSSDATGEMLRVIRSLPQLQTPPTSVIAWFLALYVFCLVPINYFVLRAFDKRELAWVTVPLIAVAFSVASYAAARSIKGSDLLTRHINIVQGAGNGGTARADAVLWLYSPRRAAYDVASDNPQMAVGDYVPPEDASGTANASSLAVRQPDASRSFRVEGADVKMWDEAQFIGQSVVNVGRGVSVQATGAGFKVRNDTPFDLRGAVLVTGGQVRACGDIKAGGAAAAGEVAGGVHVAGGDMIGRIENAAKLDEVFPPLTARQGATNDSTPRQLADSALRAALGRNFGAMPPGALLIAWSREPAAALSIEGETPRAQNVTLFVFRLPRALLDSAPARRGAPRLSRAVNAEVQTSEQISGGASQPKTGARIITYDCDLPEATDGPDTDTTTATRRWSSVEIIARAESYDTLPPIRGLSPLHLDLRNNRLDTWQPLPTPSAPRVSMAIRSQLPGRPPQRMSHLMRKVWDYRARLTPAQIAQCVRLRDGVVKVRVRLAYPAIKVQMLQVRATPAAR